jgi:hypothetical protein
VYEDSRTHTVDGFEETEIGLAANLQAVLTFATEISMLSALLFVVLFSWCVCVYVCFFLLLLLLSSFFVCRVGFLFLATLVFCFLPLTLCGWVGGFSFFSVVLSLTFSLSLIHVRYYPPNNFAVSKVKDRPQVITLQLTKTKIVFLHPLGCGSLVTICRQPSPHPKTGHVVSAREAVQEHVDLLTRGVCVCFLFLFFDRVCMCVVALC